MLFLARVGRRNLARACKVRAPPSPVPHARAQRPQPGSRSKRAGSLFARGAAAPLGFRQAAAIDGGRLLEEGDEADLQGREGHSGIRADPGLSMQDGVSTGRARDDSNGYLEASRALSAVDVAKSLRGRTSSRQSAGREDWLARAAEGQCLATRRQVRRGCGLAASLPSASPNTRVTLVVSMATPHAGRPKKVASG